MGNAHIHGKGVLLQIDRPLVPDLQPEEDVAVELLINGQTIQLDSWPSQAIVVPPPVRGVIRVSVYAISQDEDQEPRDCGHVLIPHEACEIFHEPAFQLFLGLLDSSALPLEMATPRNSVAQDLFQQSILAAKNADVPKVNLLFAACDEGLENWSAEDMWQFVNALQDKPIMRLLAHSADIVKEQHQTQNAATQELLCSHREFASKEKLYQGFVNSARVDKARMMDNVSRARNNIAELFFSNSSAWSVSHVMKHWVHCVRKAKMDQVRHLNRLARERMKHIMAKLIFPALLFKVETAFYSWKLAANSPQQQAKVSVSMIVSGIEFDKLSESRDVLYDLCPDVLNDTENAIKEVLAHAARHSFQAEHADVYLSKGSLVMASGGHHGHHSHHGHQLSRIHVAGDTVVVQATILPPKGASAGHIAKSLGHQSSLSQSLSVKLIAVPGIFSFCTGPIKIEGLTVTYVRGMTEQRIRNHNNRVLTEIVDIFTQRSCDFNLERCVHLWRKEVVKTKAHKRHDSIMDKTLRQWSDDDTDILLHICLREWHILVLNEHKRLKELVQRELQELHEQHALKMNLAERRHYRAKRAIELEVNKWATGHKSAMLKTVLTDWHEYTMKVVLKRQSLNQVGYQLQKFVDELDYGDMLTVFRAWKECSTRHREQKREESEERRIQDLMGGITKKSKTLTRHDLVIDKCLSRWADDHTGVFARVCIQEWNILVQKGLKDLVQGELTVLQEQHTKQISLAERRQYRAKRSIELEVNKWALGDTRGKLKTVLTDWHEYTMKVVLKRHNLNQVGYQLQKFVEELDFGDVHIVFVAWNKCTNWRREQKKAEAEEKRVSNLMSGKLGEAAEENAFKMTEAEQKHDSAKKSIELMVRKWQAGEGMGLVSAVYTEWHKYTMKHVAWRKKHAAVEASLHKFLEGGKEGGLHTAVLYWHKYTANLCATRRNRNSTQTALKKFLEGEVTGLMHGVLAQWEAHKNYAKLHGWHEDKRHVSKQDMQDFLDDEKRRHQEEVDALKADHDAELEKNHANVDYALKSWGEGELLATVKQFFMYWRKHAHHQADVKRGRQSVHDALLVSVEGEERAAIQLTLVNWKSFTKHERLERQQYFASQKFREDMDAYLTRHREQLHALRASHEADVKRKRATVEYALRIWTQGGEHAAKEMFLMCWREHARHRADVRRGRQAVHDALLVCVVGEERAATHLTFISWSAFTRQTKLRRERNEQARKFRETHEKAILALCWVHWVKDAKLALLSKVTHLQSVMKVKDMKSRQVKAVSLEFDNTAHIQVRLQRQCMIRAWLHYVAEEREAKEKAARLKLYRRSKDMYELLTCVVLEKAGWNYTDLFHQVLFDLWAKMIESKKQKDEVWKCTSKIDYYRQRDRDDVIKLVLMTIADQASLRKSTCFAAWVTEFKAGKYAKNLKACRAGARRQNFERVSKAVAKWAVDAEDVSLGVVLRAFGQNVADARAAKGQSKVLHVQRAWRSNALKTSSQYAEALEARHNIKALLGWRVNELQERRDSLVAQCGDWSQKYQEATMQSKLVGSHCEALRQNLAVQLLSAEQRSEEAMDQSDKLRGCTGELWTEMHRQNLALDSLEHEVLLLEAQNNGSHLYRWKQENDPAEGIVISARGGTNGAPQAGEF